MLSADATSSQDAAGGSAAGIHLLERAAAAFPEAKRRIPELRMIVVAGPRIDPRSLPQPDGLETLGYVHRLQRHLAACDLAICHGGLSATMELTAGARPFLYFPLRRHFEQTYHVSHRLRRHGAGRRMSYDADGPSQARSPPPWPRRSAASRATCPSLTGARRAAQAIGELLERTGSKGPSETG